MNQYGLMAPLISQRHRPRAMPRSRTPEGFFTAVGKQTAASITDTRDQITGARTPGESEADYRARPSRRGAGSGRTSSESLKLMHDDQINPAHCPPRRVHHHGDAHATSGRRLRELAP
jgi:hypothetical protein